LIAAEEETIMIDKKAKDAPHFTEQDRPDKVKDVYRALKREQPKYPAELKARIAASKGEGEDESEDPKEFKKGKGGTYVKKSGMVSLIEKAMTKKGSASIIRNSSDPELAARVVFALRRAALTHGS
jgi:hypothetical protein